MTINVLVGGNKRLTVRTEPNVTLQQLVNFICEREHLSNPESYGLKYADNFLDLNQPISRVNIAPGSSLVLARMHGTVSPSAATNVALLLQDGTWMTQSFAITSSLWQVLQGFEQSSNGTVNLTRRIGTPSTSSKPLVSLYRRISKKGKSSKVYMLPAVTLLDREYSTIQSLQTTTLEHARTESGSLVLRVAMRYMSQGIDKYMHDIERGTQSTITSVTTPTSSLASISTPQLISQQDQKGKARASDFERSIIQEDPALEGFSVDPQGFQVEQPQIGAGRVDSITIQYRDGHHGGPGNNNNGSSSNEGNASGEGDALRQTPTQDINSAMVEATQEIRQLREQQTQEAMTDRVKRLSKSSDSNSDKDRFVRGMGSYEPIVPQFLPVSPVSPPSLSQSEPQTSLASVATAQHDALVREIAQRVSQQMKEAQERGDSTTTYYSLLAMEIAKGQRAGVLPVSPTGSRKNSTDATGSEDQARLIQNHP